MFVFVFFFFQAEDGIRDDLVTGVQTCALPIWLGRRASERPQRCEPEGATALAPAPDARERDDRGERERCRCTAVSRAAGHLAATARIRLRGAAFGGAALAAARLAHQARRAVRRGRAAADAGPREA